MKKILASVYRCIVGSESGWGGEGNIQWYYFLALVINCMLIWWLKPEIGIIFTVFAVVHFLMQPVYASFFMDNDDIVSPIVYFAIHLAMFVAGLFINWSWTLITSAIVIVACLVAPDEMGNNIFMRMPKKFNVYFGNENKFGIFLFHTIMFAIFVTITLLLPIALWIKLAIIAGCMVLHPIIDLYEGDCVMISEITQEAIGRIKKGIK